MTDSARGADGSQRLLLAGDPGWFETVRSALEGDDVSLVTATTADAVFDELETAPPTVDCLVLGGELPAIDPTALVGECRDRYESLAIVVAPRDGSERLASEVLEAGADAYVPSSDVPGRLPDRVAAAIAAADERARERRSAAQFDALFEAAGTYRWVIEADGSVVAANGAAVRDLSDPETSLWELPSFDAPTAREVRSAVETAAGGERTDLSVELREGDLLELSFLPVDSAATVLVQGTDVSGRDTLEEELRRSERLHRITLNNMTDTVLVTDDEGRFTYVCPNVHFIFGYTAEEIHDLGTIDALLGSDLFEAADLAEEGVLTNIECTATDKVGEEHTLLVNVKEVSIQGGTRLYSCREITKRKERERALTTLHDTARRLLSAETRSEAAELLANDVVEGLPVDASACYLFDTEDTVLRPVATSAGFSSLHGPLPELPPDADSLVGRTFVRDAVAHFDDVREAEALSNPVTDLGAAAFVPIGEHGVLVVGCADRGAIDEMTVEMADLFAATAAAGLDRIDREAALHDRDETLQRRNEQLVELDRINDIIRDIDRALVQAETREEIERAVCNRLTSAGRFAMAWVGERTATGLEVRAWSGTGRSYLDSLPASIEDGSEPTFETMRTGEATVVSNLAADPRGDDWRVEALSRGFQSVISVPLSYEGATYGTMTVYATEANAVDDPIDSVLSELGETIASAIGSVRRRDALLGGAATELTYQIADEDCLLSALAVQSGAELAIEGGVERLGDRVLVFVAVEDGSVESVVEAAEGFVAIDDARAVAGDETGGTVRLEVAEPFIGTALADHGAILRRFAADPTATTLVVTVPGSTDVRTVDEVVSGWYDRADLTSRRERASEPPSGPRIRSQLTDRLTDRQLEAARTAYHSGYFESPREMSGAEVAETLDVSPTAFYQLNRKAQRTLFEYVFDGDGFDIEG